jgi:hypothetical protein
VTEVTKVNKEVVVNNPGNSVAKVVKYVVMDLTQPTVAPDPPNRKVQTFVRIGQR